jgi:hypothetical protein
MSRRQLLLLDFCCALGGAVFYFLAFDFIVGTLGLPPEMVQFQLVANFAYSLYGAFLFITRREHTSGFSWLARMNFAYAAMCILGSLYFLLLPTYPGALLLLGEALLIGLLARAELSA